MFDEGGTLANAKDLNPARKMVEGSIDLGEGKHLDVRVYPFGTRIGLAEWLRLRVTLIRNDDLLYALRDKDRLEWLSVGARVHGEVARILQDNGIEADPDDVDYRLQIQVKAGRVAKIWAPLELTPSKLEMARRVLTILPKKLVLPDIALRNQKGDEMKLG